METFPGEMPEVVDEDAQEAIYTNLDASLLRDAIETLPEEIKKTVLLHYFMDMPVKEVARVLSSPTSTITWRLHYARRILAAKLGVAADKTKKAVEKPGVKATLLALALCATAALGAAGIARWGELSGRAAAGVPRSVAAANGGTGVTGGSGGISPVTPASTPVPPDSPVPPVPDVPFVPDVPSTTLSKEQPMNTTTRSAALGAATALALAAAPPAASADGYQYIISGDPVAAAIADTDYDVSAGTSLAVGLIGGNSASSALEARRLTIGNSAGTALDSTELKAMVIILR